MENHQPSAIIFACMCVILGGCGPEDVASSMSSASESSTTEISTPDSSTTMELPTTTEAPTTTEPPTTSDSPCEEAVYPVPGAPFDVEGPLMETFETEIKEDINAMTYCAGANTKTDDLDVFVYHPTPLPEAPLPVIIMTNGAGGFANLYSPLLRTLAERGFVVASVQSSVDAETRSNAMSCTLRWLRMKWMIDNGVTPNCDLVLMGHSQGAEAAVLMTNHFEKIFWLDINSPAIDFQIKALVGLAPASANPDSVPPGHAVPYLGIMGATDEDVTARGITAYDKMVPESMRTNSDPAKLLVWPYDVPHNAFGGGGVINMLPFPVPPLTNADYRAKGEAITLAYVPTFLDMFVFGDTNSYPVLSGKGFPDSLTPEKQEDPEVPHWWSYIEPAYTELGSGPVIRSSFVVDQRESPGVRTIVEDFEGLSSFTSTTLGMGQIKIDVDSELAKDTNVGISHLGTMMRVRWGDQDSGGEITWDLDGGAPVDLAGTSIFSLRIGQELTLNPGDCELPLNDPRRQALNLTVRLEDSQAGTAELNLGPIVQQATEFVLSDKGCLSTQFMSTFRLPMSAFCQTQGFNGGSVVSLSIEFPTLTYKAGVYLDTLEFTSHSLDSAATCAP